MRFLALLTAGLAAVAEAYHKPVGDPKGNPISHPGLNQQVHKGSPFKITWNPTTRGTVTLVLLRGPSTNVKPIHVIAHKIPNNGHHTWVPSKHLEVDNTHYGMQLIVDHDGQYQYSTQFGIAPPKHHNAVDDSEDEQKAPSLHVGAISHEDAPVYTTEVVTDYTTYCPEATTIPVNNMTYTVTAPTTLTITNCPCTITHTGTSTHPYVTYSPSGKPTTTAKPTTYHSPSIPTTAYTPAPTTPAPTTSAPGSGANAAYGYSFGAALLGALGAIVAL